MANMERKLLPLLEQIATEQGLADCSIDVKPISTGGANYSSILYKAKIQNNDKLMNIFIKVGAVPDSMRETREIKIYDAETYAYTTMKKLFKQLEDKYNVPEEGRLVMPVYYGGSSTVGEEVLILEDLTAKRFSTYDRLKSIDWEYAAAAVTELAKFHALSMALAKEYPQEFNKITKELKSEWIDDETFGAFWKSGFDKAIAAVKKENKEKVKAFFDKVTLSSVLKMYDPVKKPVLTHGDYRASNLMHRYRENGSVELIPVDYQTLQASCVILDLLYFILCGTDKEFRRQYFDQLVEHYYSQLRSAMTSLGLTDEDYSRKDFEDELKERLPSGLIMVAFVLPIVTVQSDDAPKLDSADMGIIDFENIKTNDIYNKRINGIIDDYVRWGIL